MSRMEADPAKAIATLALTSSAIHPTSLLKEVVDYCMEQLEHRQSTAELLAYAKTLVQPYEEDVPDAKSKATGEAP